jgi:hypothetical protein
MKEKMRSVALGSKLKKINPRIGNRGRNLLKCFFFVNLSSSSSPQDVLTVRLVRSNGDPPPSKQNLFLFAQEIPKRFHTYICTYLRIDFFAGWLATASFC